MVAWAQITAESQVQRLGSIGAEHNPQGVRGMEKIMLQGGLRGKSL